MTGALTTVSSGAASTVSTTAPTTTPGDVPAVVAAVVAAVLGEPAPVALDLALDGCDSIDLVEIAERVEARLRPAHPAVAIDDAALARCTDVGELARLVASSLGGPRSGAPGAGAAPTPA